VRHHGCTGFVLAVPWAREILSFKRELARTPIAVVRTTIACSATSGVALLGSSSTRDPEGPAGSGRRRGLLRGILPAHPRIDRGQRSSSVYMHLYLLVDTGATPHGFICRKPWRENHECPREPILVSRTFRSVRQLGCLAGSWCREPMRRDRSTERRCRRRRRRRARCLEHHRGALDGEN
jgi:hypothetical protein